MISVIKKDSNAELPEGWKEATEDIKIEEGCWENESGFKASLYYNEKKTFICWLLQALRI